MTKLKVKVKQGAFPVRYEGERYNSGDELVIDEKHLHPSFEVIEEVKSTPKANTKKAPESE